MDQENDYKITHLADSFEEFIRGLEHESLYDLDEDADDLDEEDDADEEGTDRTGPLPVLFCCPREHGTNSSSSGT